MNAKDAAVGVFLCDMRHDIGAIAKVRGEIPDVNPSDLHGATNISMILAA